MFDNSINFINFIGVSGNGGTHTPQRRGAAPSGNLGGQMLLVPNAWARGSSLPGNMEVVVIDDFHVPLLRGSVHPRIRY